MMLIIPLPWTPSEQELRDMRCLLADALSEFIRARMPVESYIEQKYRAGLYFEPAERAAKAEEIARRVALAGRLQEAAGDWRIEAPDEAQQRVERVREEALRWGWTEEMISSLLALPGERRTHVFPPGGGT